MADTEVENVLREIRERVRAESAAAGSPPAAVAANGRGEEEHAAGAAEARPASAVLARMEANLATTERTWNRLPPLLSNRTGWVARVELWVKRKIKRALHWFTWEQVNFNSSVHHALRDAAAALAEYERRLAEHERRFAEHDRRFADYGRQAADHDLRFGDHDRRLGDQDARLASALAESATARSVAEAAHAELASLRRANVELRSLLESQDAGAGARFAEVEGRLAEAGARLETEVARLHDALAAAVAQLRAEEQSLAGNLIQLRDEQRALSAADAAARQEQLAGLRRELDERAELLREELRVCFRQLSLEAGEAAVAHDRARRHVEARLEALERASGDE